jgi:hypothetical protein
MLHATRDGPDVFTTCTVRHATDDIHTPAMPCVVGDARSVPCGELQRDGCGEAVRCRCATGDTRGWHNPPPPTHTHTHNTHRKRPFFQQCRGVCGALAEIGFERKRTNARVQTVSARPNTDVLWSQALAPLGRPTCTARAAHLVLRRTFLLGLHHQTQIRRLSGRKGELALRRTARAFACAVCRSPHRCARHSTVCASALCTADESSSSLAHDVLYTSTRRCNSARRGARRGRRLQCECCVASVPAGSVSADGEHRRHIRRHQQRGEGWGAQWAGAVSRRAECTSLSPASYSASNPHRSAHCFGVRLRARGCCGFRFRLCGAAQRYLPWPLSYWTAPSAPHSSSSATHAEWPWYAA